MKKKISIIIISAIVLALFFAFIIQKNDIPITEPVTESPPESQKNNDQPQPEIRQDPEFVESLLNGVELRHGTGPDGFYTLGHVTVEEGQRILELRFLKRDLTGHLSHLSVENIRITGDIHFVNTRFGGEAISGIRMAIGGTGPRSRVMHPGVEYKIDGIGLPGELRTKRTFPSEPTFTIPKDLPANSVYKVELVVLDEQLNKQFAEEKELDRKQYAQRVKEESITVNLAKSEVELTRGAAYYQVETYKQKPVNSGKEAAFNKESCAVIPGPNKLGGELVVVGIMTGSSGQRFLCSYAYIRNLDKRIVSIPEDADLLMKKEDMIPVTIGFDATKAPESNKFRTLGFFEKKDSKMFLVGIPFNPASIRMKDNRYEFDISIAPGAYVLKLYGSDDSGPWTDLLNLGNIEIKPDQKRYEVDIPESTDWKKLKKSHDH